MFQQRFGKRALHLLAGGSLLLTLVGCDSVESVTGSGDSAQVASSVPSSVEAASLALSSDVLTRIAPTATISGVLLASRTSGCGNDAANAGNGASGTLDWPVISGDGNVVVFESEATNLVADDDDNDEETPEYRDIFLRNLSCDTTVRVMGFAGAEPNGDSSKPKVSRDGRYVCFESVASNLVENDTNGAALDVFRYDNVTKEVILVSVNNAGEQLPSGSSTQSSISGDGKRIAFSAFGNLTGAGTGIHVRDLRADPPQTIRPNVLGGGHAERPVISADGGHVAFWSSNAILYPGEDPGSQVPDPNAASGDPDNLRFFDSRVQAYVCHLAGSKTKYGTAEITYDQEQIDRVSRNARLPKRC